MRALGRHRVRGMPKSGSSRCASTPKGPIRRGAEERPQLRRTGLSDAAKAGEPAYPVYNTWAGEGWSPSIPPKSALTRISQPGASAPAFPVATHPHG